MNHIYKVIFNKATGTFNAVAEYAKGQGKQSNCSSVRVASSTDKATSGLLSDLKYLKLSVIALGVLSGMGISSQAMADSLVIGTGATATAMNHNSVALGNNAQANGGPEQVAIGSNVTANGEQSIVLGNDVTAGGDFSIVMGTQFKTARDGYSSDGNYSVAIGSGSNNTNVVADADGDYSVAVGSSSKTDSAAIRSVALGAKASTTQAHTVALGSDSTGDRAAPDTSGYDASVLTSNDPDQIATSKSTTWQANRGAVSVGAGTRITRQITSVAAGSEDTDAVNVAQLKAVDKNTFFHVNDGTNGGTGDPANNKGKVNEAAGATANSALAAGVNAQATKENATAVGRDAIAQSNSASAYGHRAQANAEYSLAVGYRSKSTGESANAIGAYTEAKGAKSTALGIRSKTYSENGVAIGNGAVSGIDGDATIENTIAIGTTSLASGDKAVTIGHGSDANGEKSVAIGSFAQATVTDASAFGRNSTADIEGGVAIGSRSNTSVDKGVVGYDPSTNNTSTKSNTTWKANQAAVAVGNSTAITRQITSVAAGSKDTDAVNVAQLKANQTHFYSVNNSDESASNYNNDGAVGDDALAAGVGAQAAGGGAVAVGLDSNAEGANSIAIGEDAKSLGSNTIAIGADTNANTSYATAIGRSTSATGSGATAIGGSSEGNAAIANGTGSVAIGGGFNKNSKGAVASASRAVAIGTTSSATIDDSVALGSKSTANRDIPIEAGYNASSGIASTENNSTWQATTAAISVGDVENDITRQITSVAAGSEDTDAVNVAQLKTAQTHYFSVNSTDGVNYNNDGATGPDAIAIGKNATAQGRGSIALGLGSNAATIAAIAIGRSSQASKNTSVAIGDYSSTKETASTAIGYDSKTVGEKGLAIGYKAEANENNSIAIGAESVADRGVQTTSGYDASTGQASDLTNTTWRANKGAVSVGNFANTRQIINVAAGSEDTDAVNVAQLKANEIHYFSVKSTKPGNRNNNGATATDSIAIGPKAQATAKDVTAIGQGAGSNPKGNGQGDGSVYLGVDAGANGNHKVHNQPGWGSIFIGQNAGDQVTGDANIGIGSMAGMKHEGSQNIFMGDMANPFAKNQKIKGDSYPDNYYPTKTYGNRNVIFGNNYIDDKVKKAENEKDNKDKYINDAIIFGTLARAYKSQNIAIGSSTKDGTLGAVAEGEKSIAIGVGKDDSSVGAHAEADNSIAFGVSAKTTASKSIALGSEATATTQNSVALGANSVDKNAASVTDATLNGITYGNFAGVGSVANGVVSVGDAGKERQIVNVAPGAITETSTDAINGSQLHATNKALGNVATSTKTILGGNANLTPNGTITMTDIGGTGKNTIDDAIKASKTEVKAGKQVTVDPVETAADGHSIYTINATKTTLAAKADGKVAVTGGTEDKDGLIAYEVGLDEATKTIIDNATNKDLSNINNAGNTVISNIANKSIKVAAGSNAHVKSEPVTNADGTTTTTYTIAADKTVVSVEEAELTLTPAPTTNEADGSITTDYKIGLSKATKDSLVKADSALQTVVTQINGTEVKTLDKDNNVANFKNGDNIILTDEDGSIKVATAKDVKFDSVDVTGVVTAGTVAADTMTVDNANSLAQGSTKNYVQAGSQDVVNGGDVYNAIANTNQQFKGDNGNVTIMRKPNEVLTLVGGATKGTDNNIQTVANTDGTIAVKLAESVNLGADGSVTMGDVSIANTGLDNGNNKIVNVAAGTNDTDAVNVSQLNDTNTAINQGFNIAADNGTTDNVKLGDTVTYTSSDENIVTTVTDGQIDFTLNNTVNVGQANPVTINGDDGVIGGLTNTTYDPANIVTGQAATEDQLEQATLASQEVVTSEDGSITVDSSNKTDDGASIFDVSVNTDGTTITKDADGNIKANTDNFIPDSSGTVSAITPAALATSGDIANAINNSGFNVTSAGNATGTDKTLVKPSDTVTYAAGDNLTVVQDGTTFTYATAKDVAFNSVKAGPVTINNDGIDAGNTVITNVTAGTNDTDAVNVSQLSSTTAASKTEVAAGTNIKDVVKTQGNAGQDIYTVNAKGTTVTKGSEAITVEGTTDTDTNITDYKVDLNQTTKDAIADGTKHNTVVKGNNVTIDTDTNSDEGIEYTVNAEKSTVSSTSLDLTTTPDDATDTTDYKVELKQATKDSLVKADSALQTVVTQINGTEVKTIDKDNNVANFKNGDNIILTDDNGSIKVATAKDVKFDSVISNTVAADTMTVDNANSLAQGGTKNYVQAGSQDVVNGGDVYNAIANTEHQFKGDNGNVTIMRKPNEVLTLVGGATKGTDNNIQTVANTDGTIAIKLAETIDLGADGSVTMDKVSIASTGLDNGNNKIVNVAAGTNDTDAVNVSQLNDTVAAAKTTVAAGTNITDVDYDSANNTYTVNAKGTSVTSNDTDVITVSSDALANNVTGYKVDLSDKAKESLAKADTAIQSVTGDSNITATTDADNNVTVALNDDITADSVTTGDVSISTTGINAGDMVVLNVAAGEVSETSTDAVNGSQLHTTNQNVSSNTTNISANTDTINKGFNVGDGSTTNNYKLGDTVQVTGDANITTQTTSNGVEVNLNDNITVKSVTAGDTSLSENGINAGGNAITNVGPGISGTDAVNVNQLHDLGYKLAAHIDNVEADLSAGIASAAAIENAPYVPGKWTYAAGASHYNSESAIGISLRRTADNGLWSINGGVSTNTQNDPLFRIGISGVID